MNPSKAKPHAGGRGASDNASARESVSGSHHTARALRAVPCTPTGELAGDKPPLVPPGEYHLHLTHWQTAILWGRSHKVALHFRICDVGPHFGTKLARWYNVEKVKGRPSLRGHFKLRWKHDLVRDYCALIPDLKRLDRLHLERLEPLVIVARVETVTVDSRQKSIPELLQYSVVRDLLRIEAGHAKPLPCLTST